MDVLWEKFVACTPKQKGCMLLRIGLVLVWIGWLTGSNPATWVQVRSAAEYARDVAGYATLQADCDRTYTKATKLGDRYTVQQYYVHLRFLTVRLKELGYPLGGVGETGREMVVRYKRMLRDHVERVNRLGMYHTPDPAVAAAYTAEMQAYNAWALQYDPPDGVLAWRAFKAWLKKVGLSGLVVAIAIALAKLLLFLLSLVAVEVAQNVPWCVLWRLPQPRLRTWGELWVLVRPPRSIGAESFGRDPPDHVPLSLGVSQQLCYYTTRRYDENCTFVRSAGYAPRGPQLAGVA